MTVDGVGEHTIAKTLNEEGVPVMGRGKAWHRSTIAKLLRNPAVIGKLTPGHMEFDGKGKKWRVTEEPIADIFPAAISPEDWTAVRAIKDGSARAPTGRAAAHPVQNMFGGLGRCPDCGAAMTRVFKGKNNGTPKLVCTMAKAGKVKHYVSVSQDEVESAFLRNWQRLIAEMPAPPVDDHLNRLADDLNGAISVKEDHLEGVVREMVGGDVQSAARAARRIEEELRTLRFQRGEVQARIEMADRGLTATRLEGLREILEPEEGEVDRARVNAALRVLFEGVTINHRTGFLLFHWRQGGETGLMYAWRD